MGTDYPKSSGAVEQFKGKLVEEAIAHLEQDSPRQYAAGTFAPEFDGLKITLTPSGELMCGQSRGHIDIVASKRGQGERSVRLPVMARPVGHGGDGRCFSPQDLHSLTVQISCAINELLGMWAARLADSRTPGQRRALPPAAPALPHKETE